MTFLSHLINGISLGSVYAIIALGYTMVYGIAKMLNFAHGDVIMVAHIFPSVPPVYLGLSPLGICPFFHHRLHGLGHRCRTSGIQAPASGSFPRSFDHCHRRFLFSAECRPADLGLQPENLFFRNRKLDLKAFLTDS